MPSETNGVTQTSWRRLNPVMAPAVAAAATSPARTPAWIRLDGTGEKARHAQGTDLPGRPANSGNEGIGHEAVVRRRNALDLFSAMPATETFRTASILVV